MAEFDGEIDWGLLRGRIKGRMTQIGRKEIEVAGLGGLKRDYLRDFLSPKKDGSYRKESLSLSSLPKLAKGLKWTVDELLNRPSLEPDLPTVQQPKIILTPELSVQMRAAYSGEISEEEIHVENGHVIMRDAVAATWGIPANFLRDELRMRANRVHIFPVKGDSMQPALFDGDRVLIDLDDRSVNQGGLFAVRDADGTPIIKQVELLRDTKQIMCTSRNASYVPFPLPLDDTRIIGRVAAKITRL